MKTIKELVEEYAKEKALEVLSDIGNLPDRGDSGKSYWKANAKVVELIMSFYQLD